MRGDRWNDVPVSLYIECVEVVDPKDLPLYLGHDERQNRLVEKALKGSIIVWKMQRTSGNIQGTLLKIYTCEVLNKYAGASRYVDISIDALSSGYYDPGRISGPPDSCYPPEGEDERVITYVTLIFYDDDGGVVSEIKLNEKDNKGDLECFEEQFQIELNDVELKL
jgi:hypothetical protein